MGSLFWAFYWGSPGYQKLELKELIAMKKPCQLIVHLIVHLQERRGVWHVRTRRHYYCCQLLWELGQGYRPSCSHLCVYLEGGGWGGGLLILICVYHIFYSGIDQTLYLWSNLFFMKICYKHRLWKTTFFFFADHNCTNLLIDLPF